MFRSSPGRPGIAHWLPAAANKQMHASLQIVIGTKLIPAP